MEQEADDGASEADEVADDVDPEESLVHALAHVEALERGGGLRLRGWRGRGTVIEKPCFGEAIQCAADPWSAALLQCCLSARSM